MGGEDSESEEDLTEDDGSDGSESTHVSLNDDESVDDLINGDDDDEVRPPSRALSAGGPLGDGSVGRLCEGGGQTAAGAVGGPCR